MLVIYRRHLRTCKHHGASRHDARKRNCKCPIWAQGSLGGRLIRRTLDLTVWEAAIERVRKWEAQGATDAPVSLTQPVQAAVEGFLADLVKRGKSPEAVYRWTLVLKTRLAAWCEREGYKTVDQLEVAELTRFRASWPDAPLAMSLNQRRLNTFLKYCLTRRWLVRNPMADLEPLEVRTTPTLPYDPEQMTAIMDAIDHLPRRRDNVERLKALALLMRWSGLAIQDAYTLERAKLDDQGRIFLRRAKTGVSVYVPLPPFVVTALRALTPQNDRYFFWTGRGCRRTAANGAHRAFRSVWTAANISHGRPHRFRDTFAVELLKAGVPLEEVSVLLGHSTVQTTERSYRPWVRALQEKLELAAQKAWPV